MKKILFLFALLLAGMANAQTPVIIHGSGSQAFYISDPTTGYYQILSPEIWLNPDGSETFAAPTYTAVPAPIGENGPLPTGRISCAAGKHLTQMSGNAECGPTQGNVNPATGSVTHSCLNQDQWCCKIETYRSDGVQITIWGWELH